MGLSYVAEAVMVASPANAKPVQMVDWHHGVRLGRTAVLRHSPMVAQQLDGSGKSVALYCTHLHRRTPGWANPIPAACVDSALGCSLPIQRGGGKKEAAITARRTRKQQHYGRGERPDVCRFLHNVPVFWGVVSIRANSVAPYTTSCLQGFSTTPMWSRYRSRSRFGSGSQRDGGCASSRFVRHHRSPPPPGMIKRVRGRGRSSEDWCVARATGAGTTTRAGSAGRDPIKVIINGASTDLGLEAVRAISRARGMEIVGAIDSKKTGCDVGELAGLDGPLEIPIIQDLLMVLGSATQQARSDAKVVLLDVASPIKVYENVRQATAFGVRSVVGIPGVDMDKVAALSEFCEKASMGCVIAPDLSIGAAVLRQLAASAAFHYSSVSVIETRGGGWSEAEGAGEIEEGEGDGNGAKSGLPGWQALELAKSMSGLGRIFNSGDMSTENPARGEVFGDGVRIHSITVPGAPLRRHEVRFGSSGELLTLTHDALDPKAYMPGLLLAVRRVVRLRSLVYGLEKIL